MLRKSARTSLKAIPTPDRRKKMRLRVIIETLQEETRTNSHMLDVQLKRIAQLQAEVDALRH